MLKECNKHGIVEHTKLKSGRAKCKLCQSEYQQKHYSDNKDYYIKRARGREQKIIDYIADIKTKKGCSVCAEKRWWVLDFHHNDTKHMEISRMISLGYSIIKINKEIDSCILLCANCHRDLHYRNNELKKNNMLL